MWKRRTWKMSIIFHNQAEFELHCNIGWKVPIIFFSFFNIMNSEKKEHEEAWGKSASLSFHREDFLK